MKLAAEIVAVVILTIPLAVVGYLFVWAARKDGQEDRALQRRLGIRRKTRLGRCASYSSANDPVTISPAGSYVPITTPVLETLLSTSFNAEGTVPSENRRLPDPMTRGKTHRLYWSTRLWRKSVWIRFPLPCTCSSGPSSCLSAAIPSAASPSIRTDSLHSSVGRPRDTTYLVASFNGLAPG